LLLLALDIPPSQTEFIQLKTVLQGYGFSLRFDIPPERGAYGLLDSRNKTIWIDPLVFDLGIAQPTLVHEAVHAAQYCYGKGKPQPMGLSLEPPAIARRFFLRYEGLRRQLETEAYTIQVQPDRLDLVINLLHKYCKNSHLGQQNG